MKHERAFPQDLDHLRQFQPQNERVHQQLQGGR